MLPANFLSSVVRWHSTTTQDLFALESRSTHEPRLASELAAHRDLDSQASDLTSIPADFDTHPIRSGLTPLSRAQIKETVTTWGRLPFGLDDLVALSRTVNVDAVPRNGGRPKTQKITAWNAYPHEFDIPAASGILRGSEIRRNQFITTPRPGIDKRGTYTVGNDAAIGSLPQKVSGCICNGMDCSGHGYRQSRPVNVQAIGETVTQPYSEATVAWALAGLLLGNSNA